MVTTAFFFKRGDFMAIVTDITVDIVINEQTVDTFGLSKTLDNYTTDELKAALYCGMYNIARRNNVLRTTAYGWVGAFDKDNGVFQYPFKIQPSGSTYIWDSGASYEGYNTPDGIYSGVIWLRRENGLIPESVITIDNISQYRMVTEWNINKFVFVAPSLSTSYTEVSSAEWTQKPYPCCYVPEGWGRMVYHTNRDEADDETADTPVYPYSLFVYEDKLFLHAIKIEAGFIYNSTQEITSKIFGDSGYWSIDKSTTIGTSYNNDYLSIAYSGGGYNKNYSLSGYPENTRFPATWAGPGGYTIWTQVGTDDEQRYLTLWDHSGYSNIGGYIRIHTYFSRLDDVLLYFANMGVYFYTNKLYKPIITDGIVTGYTEDIETASDIDNWNGDTIHDVPITPPEPPPPPPGPYDDDPWSGISFSGVGVGGAGAFARCYYMTATELANLRTWMSGVGVPEGFNPMAQIIGLSQVPVALSGDAPETVQFINSSAVYDPGVVSRVVDSGVSTQYSMGKPISYSLGSIDLTRRMQERGEPYLDYSCQIELYLPLIGTFSLDTQAVMGRTIEAEAILDPISGTLAAYAWVSKDGQKLPVAYGSTTIGIDLPITAQQYSMSRAAAKQINAQFTASMLSSALTTVTAAAAAGSASGAAAGRAGSASGAGIQPASQFNSYAQSASIAGSQTAISQSGNVFGAFMEWGRAVRQLSYGNNTAIAGSFGGSMAQWSYPFNAYVKIIRPRYEKPRNYNHTQGVPCVQTKTIGSCTGFIQCIGADVSGITRATDLERQAIQAALCNGVYAGAGGGE